MIDVSEEIYRQFKEIMNEYSENIEEECFLEAKKICEDGKREIKTKTPKRKKSRVGGNYINTYRVINRNKRFERGCTLWNKQYQLSHLLEKNHNTSNQYGARGRTRKNVTPFWKQTEENMVKNFESAVKRIIQKRR